MQQFCQYGSVRGATGNRRPYRDNSYPPSYIYPKGMARMIEQAPGVNHTDTELILLESLVGRTVPLYSRRDP